MSLVTSAIRRPDAHPAIPDLGVPTLYVIPPYGGIDPHRLACEMSRWTIDDCVMADQDLYSGLVRLHVLYHASEDVIFGLGMMHELRRHGYRVGPGTLYPMLHRMEQKGYLRSAKRLVAGKVRRVYAITPRGRVEVAQAAAKVRELYEELVEERGEPSPAHPSATQQDAPRARRRPPRPKRSIGGSRATLTQHEKRN